MKSRIGRRPAGLAILACVVFTMLAFTGGAAAEGGGQPLAENLVEIKVADRAAIEKLMADVEAIGAEFNDHYLRHNEDDGTVTVQVLGEDAQIDALQAQGYEILGTIEDEEAYLERIAERAKAVAGERRAAEVAKEGKSSSVTQSAMRSDARAAAIDSEITINRVDYFENYAGRFLSVEAWNRDSVQQGTGAGSGRTMVITWDSGAGTEMGSGGGPRTMSAYVDTDPAQPHYLYHRLLVRVGGLNSPNTPPKPARVRVASSSGAFEEAPVDTWVGENLPPHVSAYQLGFHDRYMDPTEIYGAMNQLATEFPNIAQMINTPYKTNGYQRRAMGNLSYVTTTLGAASSAGASAVRVSSTANMVVGGRITINTGANQETRTITAIASPNPAAPAPNVTLDAPLALAHASGAAVNADMNIGSAPATAAQPSTVVVITRAWGHQGGNDTTVEFRNPGAANSPLAVSAMGRDIVVSLRTTSTGALASTAAEVVNAINAHPGASSLVKALTFRGNAGAGVVQPRFKTNLSDFLAVPASIPASGIPHDNSHVQRGPFQPQVMRIGKVRDGSKVGVYLFCQQHAREWVTPITCYETAARLLKNYATDPQTKDIVDNLDIFIMPSVNPDGGHHSFYNFQSQRRNMTNHCVVGGKATDDPLALGSDFWTPKVQNNGATPTSTDAASRNAWGVDLNRNQSVGTIFDGYVGASHLCTSDVFAGPEEVSEPEAKNEAWVVDILGPNIKFSNNIHTSGGYFMWAPGAYKPTRETLPPPNIGIEKYFFAAAETVLGRIKSYRGNVVLPERTGPIADVLYSAGGNSADDHYYRNGIIGYSFEAGSDLFVAPTLTVAANPGDTGVRVSSTTGMAANDTITIDRNGANPEIRRIASTSTAGSPNPNVILQTPLEHAHSTGAVIDGGTARSGVGFFPNYEAEGKHEANEFASGNFGLLEAALAYSRDKEAPQVTMTGDRFSQTGPLRTTFQYVNEPSVIYYTVDGTSPTFSSPKWERQGLRRPGEVFEFTETTTVRWLALDLAGNTSTGSARFAIDSTAPTSSATAQSSNGGFTTVTITASDNVPGGGSGIDKIQYRVDGGSWQTYSGPFAVMGEGNHTVEYFATDLAGNVEATKSLGVEVRTPARALERCRVAIGPKTIKAGQRTRVTVTVMAGRVEVAGQRVQLRAPGVSKAVRTGSVGVASTVIRASKAGTLRVNVAANPISTACSASKRIVAAPRARVAGTATGGAALTGRRP